MRDHRQIDSRSLALGRAVAARLAADPTLVARAHGTLTRWLATADPRVRPALLEWRASLEGPLPGVIHLLTSTDERSTRLRQSNPFAGVLPTEERNAILRQAARHEPLPT